MTMAASIAHPCTLPPTSQLGSFLRRVDYADSFYVASASGEMRMVEIYAALLGHLPNYFKHLLVLRSLIVRPLGVRGVSYDDLEGRLDTSRAYALGDKIGRWTLFADTPDEIITGSDDKHLDFRVSVFRDREAGNERVVLSTGVQTHNAFGRAYLATILPFHRFGVAQLLTRGGRSGRLDGTATDGCVSAQGNPCLTETASQIA